MWNSYEISRTQIGDRYLRHFVCSDYFHDSWITDVSVGHRNRRLDITLAAEREGARYNTRNDSRFQYRLSFLECDHVEWDVAALPCEYINGRFKLPHIPTAEERPALRLRVQVADSYSRGCGFIDVRFRRFAITRARGAIRLPARVARKESHLVTSRVASLPPSAIREIAMRGSSVERAIALEALGWRRDVRGGEAIVRALRSKDDGVLAAAVFAAGVVGTLKHLKPLARLLRLRASRIERRQILDAMERIATRSTG